MAEIVDFGLQQHKIKMDSRYFENVLSVVAGDTGRRLEVQLLDTNGMVQNTTGLNLRLNAEIAGKATFTEATLVDAATGKYRLDLSNGMFLAPGNWQFQWQITDSAGKKLHSFAFTGNIGKNISEGGSQATNFYLNLEDLKAMQDDLVNGTIDSAVLETNITEKLTDLETQYAPRLNEVDLELSSKRNKRDLISTNDIDEALLNFINDGTGGPISVESTPKNSSVTPLKIDGFEGKNFNLYVPSDHLVKGFFINATAQIIPDAINGAYAKVPVKESEYYSLWRVDGKYTPGNGVIVFRDENGDVISFIELNAYRNGVYRDVPYITFQTPQNTAHVLFNTKLGTFDSSYDSILVEGRTLSDELFRNKEVLKLFGADLVDLKTKNELEAFVNTVKGTGGNLYNKSKNYVEDMYISTNGSILPAVGWGYANVPISELSTISIWKPDGNFSGQIGAIGFYKDDKT